MDSNNNNIGSEGFDQGLPNPVDHVITKFVSRGLDKLSLEELAVTLIIPDFSATFKRRTGSDWNAKLQVKVIERLTKANFDIQWMTRHTSDPNHPFFVACSRGDIDRAIEFIRKSGEDLRSAIDPTLKTGLHFAAREGHISLVEVLIQKGFNVNARERGLKTPLHYACLYGHETIADVLLKNKADIMARDASGRTAFHFACCATSSRLITLLLGTKPELVNLTDNVGRTGLHYSVWNSSQRQVDIIRTVLENKGEVNALDDDGKTALHHASEGARSRAIPILLQKGADITIRDLKDGRTPLDLAPNDNIRQLIIVYSAPPYKVKDDDLRWMDQAVRGEKPSVKKSGSDKDPMKLRNFERQEDKMIIATFLRDKLFTIMKDIQEYGVQNAQHIKRPYLFTGSWMEGVGNLEDLYEKISSVTPLEATIRIFNIFFPYDKPYPEPKDGEPIKSSFYGDVWNFEGALSKENLGDIGRARETEEIKRLNQALEVANQRVEEKEDEAARLGKEVEILKRQMEEMNSKVAKAKQSDKAVLDIKRELTTKTDEIAQLKADLREKKLKIDELNLELETLQNNQADEDLQEKLDQAMNRIADLEQEVSTVKEKEKSIRFKSGQMFLAALDSRGAKGGQKREVDLNLRDDRAIVKLYRALKENPPSLEDRLKEFDRDGDGKLNRTEFIKVFEKLKLARKDILSLLRVCGFNGDKELVGIQEFIKILQDRPKLREKWEEELFFKLLDHFKENDIDIDNAFKLMDVSGDGVLNMSELQEGLAKFNIRITDKDAYALFDIFDESDDGSIQLEEFRAVLKEYEQIQQEQIGAAKPRVVEEIKGPKGDLVPTDDATFLHGELKVQIPSSKGIDPSISELFLKFYLLGATLPKIVKTVKLTTNPEGTVVWNIAIKIPIILILRENLYDQVWLKIFTNETREDESSYFGEVQLDWKNCLGTPEKWIINSEFPLSNKSYPKKKVEGGLLIQGKWIPSTSKDYKSSNFSKKEIQSEFLSPISDEGTLEFLLGTTINCWYHEDVSCDVVFSNGSKKTFKAKFNKEGDAYWNESHSLELRVTRDTPLNNMQCLVYNKSGLMGKQNIIGSAQVDWEECLKFPGEVNPNKVYLLGNVPKTGKPCKLYVKTKWVSKSGASAVEVAGAKQTQGKKVDENVESGLLKFNIIRARGLMVADMKTSDPVCKLTFNGVEKIQDETQVVKNSLTPQWNKWFELPVKFRKDGFIPPVDLKVYDWDLTFNDLIGLVSVDWTEAYRNPLTWAINKKFKLENPDPEKYKSKNNFGEIYIQAYYAPPGQFDPNTKPEDLDLDKDEQKALENKVAGTLVVEVVHAKNIYAGENGKVVNPLAVVNFPNGKTLETDAVKATSNPIWKKRMDVAINNMKKDEIKPLVVQVKEDRFIRGDQLLSFVYIPWDECIAKPGTWAINKVYKLEGSAEFSKNQKVQDFGDIYIQAKFIEEGMVDDGKPAKVIEDIAISGSLLINVVFGKGLRAADTDTSDPYCEILLPDKTKLETKTINNILNPVWNFKSTSVMKIPYEKYKPIKFDVYDDDGPLMTDDVLGTKEIEWKTCIENSGKWMINDLIELDGPEEIKAKKNLTSFGHIYVQMMFVKEGLEIPKEAPEVKFDLTTYLKEQEEIMKQSVVGTLFVNVIHGKGLARGDKDSSDSFCRITFPNGDKVKSETKDKDVNPIWNFKQNKHINIIKKNMKPIKIDVWDHDFGLNADDHLGYVQIDWNKCIENSGKWAINEIFTIQAPPDSTIVPDNNKWGELYVQAKFLKDGTADDPKEPELVQNLAEVLKVESIPIEGKLSIRIIHGKNLPVLDTVLQGGKADPFVKVILPIGCKDYQTAVVGSNLNPIWNDKKDLDVAIAKNNIRPIRFEVWDEDSLSMNDKIGEVKISLQECMDNSGRWHINKVFKIESSEPLKEGEAAKNLGELYLQVMFTKKGDIPDTIEPKLVEDLKTTLAAEVAPIEGRLVVNINHAKNLYANDGKTSDPYCKIILPGGIKEETPHVSKTITPIWKYKNNFKISVPKNRLTTLNVQVWDHDKLFDDCIGYIEIPLLDMILAPGVWKVNGLYDLKVPEGMAPNKAAKGLGQIYLQAMFLNSGMANETTEPQVTDDIESQVKAQQEKLEGDLHINIIHAKSLLPVDDNASTSDPFVKITFNDKTLETKHLSKTLNPIWNLKGNKIAVSVSKNNVPPLGIQVIDHNTVMSNSLIGLKEINIMDELVPNPDKWVINKSLKLTGPQHLVQKLGPGVFGDVYLQIKFVPAGTAGSSPDPEVTEDLEAILKVERELRKGNLMFNVIHAKGLVTEDKASKDIEAICKVKIPGLKEEISVPKAAAKGDKPQWNFKKDIRISISKKNEEPIRVEVYHHRTVLKNVLLGFVDLRLEDILDNPGKWHLNGNLKLSGPENLKKLPEFAQGFGEIYLQSKFVKEGEVDDKVEAPVTEDLQAIIKQEAESVKGTLKMNVVHCRKLLPGRKLDPYVKVFIDKTQIDKTEAKTQTSNPIWKKEIKYVVNSTKQNLKNIKINFEVWDHDKLFDDKIGYLELSLNEIYELNGGWYNQISRLNGTDKMKQEAGPAGIGDLYVQLRFLKDTEADDGSAPPLLENLEEIVKKENEPIKGKLKVHVVHAKDLIAADSSFIQGSKSDPYCKVTFPDGSTLQTGVTKQNLTAIWKEMMAKDINIPKSTLTLLKFEVWDEDSMASDEIIGFINVNWKACIDSPGEWAINEIRPLDGPDELVKSKKYPKGFGSIYIQVQWLPEGMNDPGTGAKLIEDLGAPNCKKK